MMGTDQADMATMECFMCLGAGSFFQYRPGSPIPIPNSGTECAQCGGSGKVPTIPASLDEVAARARGNREGVSATVAGDPFTVEFGDDGRPSRVIQTATTVYEGEWKDTDTGNFEFWPRGQVGILPEVTAFTPPSWHGKGRLTVRVTWEPVA